MGSAGVRPDVRRRRRVRKRAARRGQRQARHRHVPRRATRLRRPASAGVLHRPELHLPPHVREARRVPAGRRARPLRPAGAIDRRLRGHQSDLPPVPHGARRRRPDVEQQRARTPHGLSGGDGRRDRRRGRHRHRHRPRATLRRSRKRLEPLVLGRRPDVVPSRGGRVAGPFVGRGVRAAGACPDGPVGAARQRGRHRAVRADGLRARSGARHQAQERHQREALRAGSGRGGTRRARIPTPGSLRTRRSCAASPSRCSTARAATCD